MTIIKVVEPHAILRLGLLQLIVDAMPDMKLEGADYAGLYDTTQDLRGIDLVLLSISPTEDISHLVDAALHVYSPRAIMLLSDNSTLPPTLSLPTVVAGYVPKNSAPEVLQAAIRLVLAGGSCFPSRKQLPLEHRPGGHAAVPGPTQADAPPGQRKLSLQAHAESELLGLTPRQYEVLVLLSKGYPMKTVGRYLNISVATAKAHTETLYQRLDVHNRNAAVYAAVSRGAKLGWASIGGHAEGMGRRPGS